MGVVRVTIPIFKVLAPNHIFGVDEARHFKCHFVTDTEVF